MGQALMEDSSNSGNQSQKQAQGGASGQVERPGDQKQNKEKSKEEGRTGGRNQPKDRSVEGTSENLKGLQKEQKRITKQGGYRIRTQKAEQNIDRANKQIKTSKDIKENQ